MRHRQSNFSVLVAVCLVIILHARFLPASPISADANMSRTAEALIAPAHVVRSFPAVAARAAIRQHRSLTPLKQKSADALMGLRSLSGHVPVWSHSAAIEASAAPADQQGRTISNRSPPIFASHIN